MATNYSNYTLRTITNTKIAVPFTTNGTGTISTTGTRVIGTGTLFMTEMPAGSWLFDLTQNEFRRIKTTLSDTVALLEDGQPFTTDISGDPAPEILSNDKVYACEISILVVSGSATITTTEDSPLGESERVTIPKSNRDDTDDQDLVNPCIVEASGVTRIEIVK